MQRPDASYQSYLLRLWRAGKDKPWRVMLEHVGSHQRRGFIDLESLCAFLQEQMDDDPQASPSPGEESNHT